MKSNRKSIILSCISCVLALLMLSVLALPAFAEAMTGELIYLSNAANLAVTVTYTDDGSGAEPDISFISPYGEEFSEVMGNEGFSAEHDTENNKIYY